jgi:hypothetical protein
MVAAQRGQPGPRAPAGSTEHGIRDPDAQIADAGPRPATGTEARGDVLDSGTGRVGRDAPTRRASTVPPPTRFPPPSSPPPPSLVT